MWDIVGGYADNDKKVILDHYEEIDKICDRILDGCKDTFIRNDACVMKGKLLFAKGKKQEAIDLYKNSLPDWYQTSGQKIEQIEYANYGQKSRTTYEYDAKGNCVKHVLYDSKNKVVRIRKFEYYEDGSKKKQYNYDPDGKLVSTREFEYIFE